MPYEAYSLTSKFRLALLARIDRFQAATKMTDSRISRSAVHDTEFVTRLRLGRNVTIAKISRLETWLMRAEAEHLASRNLTPKT